MDRNRFSAFEVKVGACVVDDLPAADDKWPGIVGYIHTAIHTAALPGCRVAADLAAFEDERPALSDQDAAAVPGGIAAGDAPGLRRAAVFDGERAGSGDVDHMTVFGRACESAGQGFAVEVQGDGCCDWVFDLNRRVKRHIPQQRDGFGWLCRFQSLGQGGIFRLPDGRRRIHDPGVEVQIIIRRIDSIPVKVKFITCIIIPQIPAVQDLVLRYSDLRRFFDQAAGGQVLLELFRAADIKTYIDALSEDHLAIRVHPDAVSVHVAGEDARGVISVQSRGKYAVDGSTADSFRPEAYAGVAVQTAAADVDLLIVRN